MKLSRMNWVTYKEAPAEAEVISQQLMLRAGLIKKLASGLYTWLPMGLRVIKKLENIVREEMNLIGGQEILMPMAQPGSLWKQSGRWDQFGPELLRFTDRHDRDFCLGPTHEEVVSDLAGTLLQSYKDTPCTFYQIQTKFRDEIRPRFGVMRSREFIMKDAYSFHLDNQSLEETYLDMRSAYTNILNRLKLNFKIVTANSGAIGGDKSEEFHVLASSGEDLIGYNNEFDYAANVETINIAVSSMTKSDELPNALEEVETKDKKSIDDLAKFLGVDKSKILKTLIYRGINDEPIAILIRGDHELNPLKAELLPNIKKPLELISQKDAKKKFSLELGFVGPLGLKIKMYADANTKNMKNFICGLNQSDKHAMNVNWERDIELPTFLDLRLAQSGDHAQTETTSFMIDTARGIEVGHIFQLGRKYSESFNLKITDQDSSEKTLTMGCYGIGIGRLAASCIEQKNDPDGIIWPESIAPFRVVVIPITNKDNRNVIEDESFKIYQFLMSKNIDVAIDDRELRPGNKFADADLIGIPIRIVISEKNLSKKQIEIKYRDQSDSFLIDIDNLEKTILGS